MITVQGQLLYMLESVAEALGDELRGRLVFVGGCTTALFITDPITLEGVRTTDDVDLIVDLAGYSEWAELQAQLRRQGFFESPEETVICRMRLGELKVDFMPDDERILGFSNRWYAKGIKSATQHKLTETLEIKLLTPPLFVATKLEAYRGRGEDDLLTSRDIEDILLIIDGREKLIGEVQSAEENVRNYIEEQLHKICAHRDFENFLAGNIREPEGRVDIVRDRFYALSKWQEDT